MFTWRIWIIILDMALMAFISRIATFGYDCNNSSKPLPRWRRLFKIIINPLFYLFLWLHGFLHVFIQNYNILY